MNRRKREEWLWDGIEIEEVDRFKYLCYTLQRNNGTERHIKETFKKVMCHEAGMGNRIKKIRWRF